MDSEVVIDGSQGEGGGQVLRSALALSLATGRAVRVEKIRAGRPKPGLLRQHLTALQLAARIGSAEVEGDALGARTLRFAPQTCLGGTYHVRIGSAGSTSLVAQAVLPALLLAEGPTELIIEGGTHARSAPTFEFLRFAYLRVLEAMGAGVEATLERAGFFPAGGGVLRLRITPCSSFRPLELRDAGARRDAWALVRSARIPHDVAERELAEIERLLRWPPGDALRFEEQKRSPGAGNAVMLCVAHEHVTEVFSSFGARGLRAERVAKTAVDALKAWERAACPVGPHLADQLMLPMALGAGGVYRTSRLTAHATTNRRVIEAFLGPVIDVHADGSVTEVRVRGRAADAD